MKDKINTSNNQTSTNISAKNGGSIQVIEHKSLTSDIKFEQNEISNKTSPYDSMLLISTIVGEVLDLGSSTHKPKKEEVYCTSIFKNPANISGSLSKLWTEVINIIENTGNAGYNEDMQRHAYPNSEEFEVSNE